MQTSSQTDYLAILKETLDLSLKNGNVVPLLVDALIVLVLGGCTAGLLLPPLMHGYTVMTLKVVRGEPIKVGDSLQGFQHFVPAFVLGLLLLLAAVVGSITVVGGLILMFLFTYAYNVMADRPGMGAVDSLKASYALVKDHPIDTLVVWGVAFGLGTVLGSTGVGAVVAYAYTALLTTVFYAKYTAAQPSSGAAVAVPF